MWRGARGCRRATAAAGRLTDRLLLLFLFLLLLPTPPAGTLPGGGVAAPGGCRLRPARHGASGGGRDGGVEPPPAPSPQGLVAHLGDGGGGSAETSVCRPCPAWSVRCEFYRFSQGRSLPVPLSLPSCLFTPFSKSGCVCRSICDLLCSMIVLCCCGGVLFHNTGAAPFNIQLSPCGFYFTPASAFHIYTHHINQD